MLLPPLLAVSLAIDLFRFLTASRSAILSRGVIFGWLYLVGETWAVIALGFVWLFGRRRATLATYRLQAMWADWNVAALRAVFGLKFLVEGGESVAPGPVLVLSRHVSLIDSLLPAQLVANRHRIRLRYVLKRELLFDPALDIAGNRLTNYFVDRRSRNTDAEIASIRELGSHLEGDEGVVIFPEGTRFSEAKLKREVARAIDKKDNGVSEIVQSLRSVLPPKPAGTMALIDKAKADVVFLGHHGLENFAGLDDIWSGQLVGSTISVRFWRVPYGDIPVDRMERIEWLYRRWADIDRWIEQRRA